MDLFSRIFDWLREQEAGFSALAAIAVLGGIVFTGVRFLMSRRSQPAPEAKPEDDPLLALPTGPVVAVLPFENLSRDPDQEYFSDGLTDDIITALSRFKDLFVIARNSTFRYKGQAVDVRQLNKELGARYVLEGSVQRAGDALRIAAQLLDANDGTHLWAETYDRELSASDIFAVQDEITERVVGTIAGVYGVISRVRFAEIKDKPFGSLDAYESVLQAQAYARDNYFPSEHAKIRDCLERAVKSDPGYSEAWARLSFNYIDEHKLNYNPRPDSLGRALDAARRAVISDSNNQTAHHALAAVYFHRHQLDEFFAETEHAIALNPNNAELLSALGQRLYHVGDKRGILLVRRATKLDPFHPLGFIPIAEYHFDKGEYEEALAAVLKSNAPGIFWLQVLLAGIYAELDRQSEARRAVEELLRLYPGFTTETLSKEWQKWNRTDEVIDHWIAALRKAGLPEGTEA